MVAGQRDYDVTAAAMVLAQDMPAAAAAAPTKLRGQHTPKRLCNRRLLPESLCNRLLLLHG
jgi:hypothetical protein